PVLAFSLPVTAAGVLLTPRGLRRTVFGVSLTLIALFVLAEVGVLTNISNSGLEPIEAVLYSIIILVVNGVMLGVFAGGQMIIFQQNLELTENLEQAVTAEQTAKGALEQAVTDYSAFAQRVAAGDLSAHMALDDTDSAAMSGIAGADLYRLGQSLNAMVESFRVMTEQIWSAAAQLSAESTDILAATTEQMAAATEQSASISQTAATLEQVRRTIQQTNEQAAQVAEATQQALQIAIEGQTAVTEAIDGMQTIDGQVDDIAHSILELASRTQQIGEIIASVSDIADQSKLLALNASIEAARAGEEGRGFAVVAMEVRNLAEQSQQATQRITEILGEIQQQTNTAVMVTEEGSKGAALGVDLVARAGEAISQLADTMQQSSQAVTQIAGSTGQQLNGIEQLAIAMTTIRQASEEAANSTRQTEENAQNLSTMARQMEEVVAQNRT
ncbi:methyl-accepting chemotaxis protein, partial [Chloroflexota bacterium]